MSQALRDNSALKFERPQAEEEERSDEEASVEAGASRWEAGIYLGSSSKSAYLSKLANAVSQIKRASDCTQLDFPSTASEPTQARQLGKPAQAESRTKLQSSHGAEMLDKTRPHDRQAHAGTSAEQHRSASALLPVSENELQRLMQLLSGKT